VGKEAGLRDRLVPELLGGLPACGDPEGKVRRAQQREAPTGEGFWIWLSTAVKPMGKELPLPL
jgi:hypothetical protein